MGKKKKDKDILDEIKEILLERLKEMSVADVLQYGGLTIFGVFIYDALGKVPVEEWAHQSTDSDARTLVKMRYNSRRQLRVALVNLTKMLNFNIPLVNIRPFEALGGPILALIDVQKEMDFPEFTGPAYYPVPNPYRVALAVALPSIIFILMEFAKGTVEISGLL